MEQAGCWHLWVQMTEEQKDSVASTIQRWSDGFNESSPEGQGCISDPRSTEIERLEKVIKDERLETEQREWIYQKHIAGRRDVHVGIRHGCVEVEAKR